MALRSISKIGSQTRSISDARVTVEPSAPSGTEMVVGGPMAAPELVDHVELDLFSLERPNDGYKGEHEAPDPESGAPITDPLGIYPDDFYGPGGLRLYAGNDPSPMEREAYSCICGVRGKPTRSIRVYRAIPYEPTIEEQVASLENCKRMWQRRATKPKDAPTPPPEVPYYDFLCLEIERLNATAPVPVEPRRRINPGDWVTPIRAYAKEHGESNLNNRFKIVSAVVPAGSLYTEGNSLLEMGYWPEGSYVPTPDAPHEPHAVGTTVSSRRDQTETPEFKAWFRNSKIVDAEGKPLRVYHGTKSEVTAFNIRLAGKSDPGLVGKAFYFTPSPEQAGVFAESPFYGLQGGAPNVVPVYLSVENPIIIADGVLPDGRPLNALHPNGITPDSGEAFQGELRKAGHDGAIFMLGGEITQVAVFGPTFTLATRIKSAIGNRGSFSPNNPDIGS